MDTTTITWSSEDDSRLIELLSKGHSYQEVADMMLRTRSSIAGRAHRLKHKGSTIVRKKIQRKVLTLPIDTSPQEFLHMKLIDLGPKNCRWPSDEKVEGQYTFCGVSTLEGKSYCGHHYHIGKGQPWAKKVK